MSAISALVLVALAVGFAGPVMAGTTGVLNGTIRSANGVPVIGATVTATGPAQIASTVTNANGFYSFASLSPGPYAVSVSDGAFGSEQVGVITVVTDEIRTLSRPFSRILILYDLIVKKRDNLVQPGNVADEYVILTPIYRTLRNVASADDGANPFAQLATVPGTYVSNDTSAIHAR